MFLNYILVILVGLTLELVSINLSISALETYFECEGAKCTLLNVAYTLDTFVIQIPISVS